MSACAKVSKRWIPFIISITIFSAIQYLQYIRIPSDSNPPTDPHIYNCIGFNNETILKKLESININQQLELINKIYVKLFNRTFSSFIFNNLSTLTDNDNVNRCIVLTPIVINNNIHHDRQYYNRENMKYAYLSKLKYSQFHSYLNIIDTFDYLTYLNVSRKVVYSTPTQNYTKEIRNHWNKVLSLLYWSKYSNCILNTDDDAFIGNYHLSIKYWIHLNKNIKTSFLILPYEIGAPRSTIFSNYGFIMYDANYMRRSENDCKLPKITKFLLNWWNNRNMPAPMYDQGTMFYAILDYVYYNHIINMSQLSSSLFKKCRDHCRIDIPDSTDCTNLCYQEIGIQRPTQMDIINYKYNLSVLYTPAVWLKLKNKTIQQYDIYPFSINLHWKPTLFAAFSDLNQKEYNKLNFSQKLANTKFMFDNTYLLHLRWKEWMKNLPHRLVMHNAVDNMEIFTLFQNKTNRLHIDTQ